MTRMVGLFCLLAAPSLGQEVVFTKRPALRGDTSRQVVRYDLAAERTIRQQNQLIDVSKQTLRRDQARQLTVVEVAGGLPTKARLEYGKARTRARADDSRVADVNLPVANKKYLVARTATGLTILDASGKPISKEEDELLRGQLAGFGTPNPLAEFLDGRRIAVGQQVDVPNEVADQLLGVTGKSGETDKLSLRLESLQTIEGVACATFRTLLRSSNRETSMSLLMNGELIVEVNTCGTRGIHLQGPIAISEVRGPTQGQFVVSTSGNLEVRLETSFSSTSSLSSATQGIRR